MTHRVSYGVGHAMISAKNMLFHFFFLFYFVTVRGLPEWQVMVATLIAIAFDSISDPVMGQISDNTRSLRWGRRHGWMLLGLIPTTFCLALLFSPPDSLGQLALFLWMMVFMVATRLAVTIYTVPYFALQADLTSNYHERTTLSAFREIFSNVFNLLVFVFGYLIFLPDRDGLEDGMLYEAGYGPFALTMGLIGVVGGLILYGGTRDKIPTMRADPKATPQAWTTAFRDIGKAFRLAEFRHVTIAYSVLVSLYGTISQLSLFVGVYLWQFSQVQKLIASLIPFIVIVPAALFATYISRRIDKRRAAIGLTLLFGTSFSIQFILYLVGLTPPIGSDALLLLVAVTNGFGYAGFVGTIILSFSMLADVSDLVTAKSGRRQEALLFAGFSFANKLAFASGLIIATIGLMVINLPDGALPSEIGPQVTYGLAWYSIAGNVILMLGALWFFSRYTLTQERHARIKPQPSL